LPKQEIKQPEVTAMQFKLQIEQLKQGIVNEVMT
jgi:hypothetical protein